jgi:hypothetical protein
VVKVFDSLSQVKYLQMKTKLERLLLGLIIAPLAPLAGFLGCWSLSYFLLPEDWIPYGTLVGLLAGIFVDIFILKKLLDRARHLSSAFWMAVLLFYTIGMFGMFMGVPVFNVTLAIPAGFVVGTRLAHEMADSNKIRLTAIQTCTITTGLLTFVCAASAFFALASSSTPSDLEGMFGFGFTITPTMIWGIILVGGVGLLAINWILTGLSIHLTARFLRSRSN